MTTLMVSGKGDGRDRRCDEKCYNAKWPTCTCCCGGMNHGVGLKRAGENTAALSQKWLDEAGVVIPEFQMSLV